MIHIEDSTDGNEDGQSDKEASPSTIPDSELPAGPNGVDDGAIRGSESANGIGVLAASGDASEGGGGVFGEGGDDLTEEERETVSHVFVERFDSRAISMKVWIATRYITFILSI